MTTATRATGWLFFAGTVLGIAGLMRIVDAIWAFRYDGAVPDDLRGGVLGDDLTTYGWAWLIVGLILVVSSFLILTGSQIARWVGFVAAAIAAISAMAWMPYYPVWSLTYVVVALFVIHALATYGDRPEA